MQRTGKHKGIREKREDVEDVKVIFERLLNKKNNNTRNKSNDVEKELSGPFSGTG
jgi:hypothetical protein